ncbi:phosphatidylinositol 4-phosphate 3-kinase C2 domain-containing subunit beta [Spea bombifrons]|uniref:phosphatidylinositol 4-phosphate 3-kinase C2 domain-containing subunit beta n=1 Tax=Spea bombifrons TaxID=233779 RepID=UPI00234B55B6|nr:phosphatidylinositol 4-phosphate 3-kinase C2 domain-containing subunit beta [Spea bombifrons]XP_053310323.1 phosphatidylinositol 4-phosphate 3-kinase C2 domain-containing subunit beta [Spea bombifrons]
MSTSGGNREQWQGLESLGISQKELALAEALQMEYDALSRLRQEKRPPGSNESHLISWDVASQTPATVPLPPRTKPPPSEDYLYIYGDGYHSNGRGEERCSPKNVSPPPLPPRTHILTQRKELLPANTNKSYQSRDVNVYSGDAEGKLLRRTISQMEEKYEFEREGRRGSGFSDLDYERINDTITHLNLTSTYDSELLRQAEGHWKEVGLRKKLTGKPVSRSNTLPPQVPPRTYGQKVGGPSKGFRGSVGPDSFNPNPQQNGCDLFEMSEQRDEETAAFCHMLDILRSRHSITDQKHTGIVWSPVNLSPEHLGHGVSLKVTVICDGLRDPLTFTCDCSSTVDLLIYQTLCYTSDDLEDLNVSDYLLKLCGLEEFLQNEQALGSHEYIQQCRKFDVDVRLHLIKKEAVRWDLARSASDTQSPSTLNHHVHLQERPVKQTVTRQALTLLFDTFHNEVEEFVAAEADFHLRAERVVQSVKAICNALAAVETLEISNSLNQLPPCPSRVQIKSSKDPNFLMQEENREKVVEGLTAAILDLVQLYCSTFNADFQTVLHAERKQSQTQDASLITSPLAFTVYAAHRVPISWVASYEDFYVSCSLSHGGKELCSPLQTRKIHVYKYLFHLLVWDQMICFPVQINHLPRETLLTVTLYAVPVPPPGSSSEASKQRRNPEALGWVTTPLFDFRQLLTCGRRLFGLWPTTKHGSTNFSTPNVNQPDSIILQIDFPTSAFNVKFTKPEIEALSPKYEFSSLSEEDRSKLQEAMQKESLYWLTEQDKKRLWEKRYYCHSEVSSLPLLLASAPSWEWACLPDIYALLGQWTHMKHQDALGLLHATFPDQDVRRTAVQWIDSISDSELLDYLPQLVQALKYECYLDSPLVRFLLKRAICDLRITHYFFWLLKDCLKDSQFSIRYQYLLAALLCCCGKGLREEFDRQCGLVNTLTKLAQKVREGAPSSRSDILRNGLEDVKQFFNISGSCRLPLSPSLLVKGIVPQDCSHFNSNAVPLKLTFQNVDPLGENIRIIFKCGDDLRQDMLTLQMIRIMNKIWIQEGLDMRMVIFRCFSTGRGRGMVEMIPTAETLRKIQVEHGVTGSFKDRPLAEWLKKHNPTEDEYDKAVENFIYSCAGCCVATYVLGICDRHNDNIMLKTSGHMFHIDFGRFLGHAQMFGNIKRDRAPFVFTSDMAYVINGGDKTSSRFHDFVDLCCQAYNLIRKHTHLFLNLLGLMLSCGIPELSDLQDLKYVYDALRPQDSESDATTYFTRLIESSLGSVATKLNFFFHNLAQLKFSSSDERLVLSFAPRTYTIKTDGRICDVFLTRYKKIFTPNKGYVFVIRVVRESPQETSHIQRSFEEFQELHTKLRLLFPSSQLPSFPSRFVIGRSRGEAAAERRKEELNGYIWHLIHATPEVAECDLVYTFFHPLPRDEKNIGNAAAQRPSDATWSVPVGTVGGEVKLSISYKNDKLFIMVMHIRGLPLQDNNEPNPYVKIYLLPDPQKTTKRKTKVARKTCNPTYNEMLVYDGIPKGDLQRREIHLSVLSEVGFWENILLGEVSIKLRDLDLTRAKVCWFQLGFASQAAV